jgi:hypothetical protein
MFGIAKRTPLEVPVATKLTDFAMNEQELAAYVKVAAKIGLYSGALLKEILLHFLSDEGICVYNLEHVEKYLDAKFGSTDRAMWGWWGLRSRDVNAVVRSREGSYNGDTVRHLQYRQPVPLPVLLSVDKIVEKFPDLYFYVADKVEPSDFVDPFLAVTGAGLEFIVIERWNEPSFRM